MQPADHIAETDGRAGVQDALTELHAYRLILDGELERLETRIAELARSDEKPDEVGGLAQRCTEIRAELELLSRMITALRTARDPAGQYL
jgi:hypothetical protein